MKDLLRNPVIVALDVDDASVALKLAEKIAPYAGCIKLGPRLVLRHGPSLVRDMAKLAPVFLDFKFFDIPSTMEGAVRAAFDAGATLVTVHALSGSPALTRLAKVEAELSAERPFALLGVTLLTSFSQEDLPTTMSETPISQHVDNLAAITQQAGIRGLVCSPQEASALRGVFPKAYLVTPGIRFTDSEKGDQSRTTTPYEAMKAGASALVIGRPILESPNPVETLQRALHDVESALAEKK